MSIIEKIKKPKVKPQVEKSKSSLILVKSTRKVKQNKNEAKKTTHPSQLISQQIQYFLESGGKIKTIASGISGQVGGLSFRKSMTIKAQTDSPCRDRKINTEER